MRATSSISRAPPTLTRSASLAIRAERRDVRHVVDAIDLRRERGELATREPEVHRRGVALDEVHAPSLLER